MSNMILIILKIRKFNNIDQNYIKDDLKNIILKQRNRN